MSFPGSAAFADDPFTITASTGQAGAHVDATVTRRGVTLPAALVPYLKIGDVVRIDFHDYKKPRASWNYFINVAFISAEGGKPVWLFPRNGDDDALFSKMGNGPPKRSSVTFTYGKGGLVGVPIFFIVPEDKRAGGMDGVRAYVENDPNDFIKVAVSSNNAVEEQSWLSGFLNGLQNGSIDPLSGQANVENLAASLGANQSAISACYNGGSKASVTACLYSSMEQVNSSGNFNATTLSGFLGATAGAGMNVSLPISLAAKSMLTVWSWFHNHGREQYEYLPTTLQMQTPNQGDEEGTQLLKTVSVPTIRPYGKISDVLFFTIGGSDAQPPVVERDGPAEMCGNTLNVAVPFHLSHTSTYVHDLKLVFTPDDAKGTPVVEPLDARLSGDPMLPLQLFEGKSGVAWSVRLHGTYGFDDIDDPLNAPNLLFSLPKHAAWNIFDETTSADGGSSLDLVADSDAVPCLASVALRQGSGLLAPMQSNPLGSNRVKLHVDFGKNAFVPGPAELVFHQNNPPFLSGLPDIVDTQKVLLRGAAPKVTVDAQAPVANIGDPAVALNGSHFENVAGVALGGARYMKESGFTSTSACFVGPPISNAIAPGASITAQLLLNEKPEAGETFPLTIQGARPVIRSVSIQPASPLYLSTDTIKIVVTTDQPIAMPHLRIRQANGTSSDCSGVSGFAGVAVPDAMLFPVGGNELDAIVQMREVLPKTAYGVLSVQATSDTTKSQSNWATLPGTFARAPWITQILCTAKSEDHCEMNGTDLDVIDGIESAPGTYIRPPYASCKAQDQHQECITVPRLAHYALQSLDGAAPIAVPDTLIVSR
jgi:hypothetical protein